MSAIAIVLAEMGHQVSGSDIRERPVLDRVRAAGVDVHVGHDRRHVAGCAAVTASTAVPGDEHRARRSGANRASRCLTRAGMLSSICAQAKSLGVAGTHGKTSTTSMLMLILAEAGLRPVFIIGGDVTDMGTGAQWTGGEWLVVEADESDGTHLELPLFGTILTNVEVDHLDFYGTEEAIVDGFDQYLAQIAGPKVLCIDDPVCAELAARHGAITYGTSPAADFRAVDVRADHGSYCVHRRASSARRWAASTCRCAASTTCATRSARWRWRARSASTSRSPRGRSPSSAASLGGSTSAASTAARRWSTTTPTCRARSAPCCRLRAQQRRRLAACRRGVPTEPVQPHGGDVARVPRCVRRCRPGRAHRHLRLRHDARSPASRASSSSTRCSTPTPTTRLAWMPRRDDLIDYLAKELRDGDVCISMGCGDIASLPDEVQQRRAELRATAS